MVYPIKTLGQLCSVRIGRTPRRDSPQYWGGSAPWITVRELDGGVITGSKEQISDLAVREVMPPPVPAGTLLYSFKLSIGKIGIAGIPLYTNEAIASLEIRNPEELDRDYLRYALLTGNSESGANHAVLGKVLNKAKVEALPVPLPPINEQRRIVDLLARAEGIVRLRREAEKKAAELIPALFLDMFGDPARNPKGWQSAKFEDCVDDIRNGLNPSKDQFGSGTRFITVNDLYDGIAITGKKADRVVIDAPTRDKYRLRSGDLCFVRSSVKRAGVGMASVYVGDDEAVFGGFVIRARLNQLLLPVFACAMFHTPSMRKIIVESAGTGTITNINQPALLGLPVIAPPLDLQKQFVQRLDAAASIQSQQAAATSKAQETFKALLAGVFSAG